MNQNIPGKVSSGINGQTRGNIQHLFTALGHQIPEHPETLTGARVDPPNSHQDSGDKASPEL